MTFTKENAKELGRKGGITTAANRRAGVEALLDFEMQGGAKHMLAIREKQLRGEPLTDSEVEFKKDYKDFMEYHTAKKARLNTTLEAKVEQDIEVNLSNLDESKLSEVLSKLVTGK